MSWTKTDAVAAEVIAAADSKAQGVNNAYGTIAHLPKKEMSLPGMVEGVRGSPTIKRPVAFDNMTSPFDVDASVSNLVHCRLIAVLRG